MNQFYSTKEEKIEDVIVIDFDVVNLGRDPLINFIHEE